MSITWKESGKTEYEGAVLAYPVYHTSAFSCDYENVFARVWTGQNVCDIDCGTVSYGSAWVKTESITIDATPGVKTAAAEYERQQFAATCAMNTAIKDMKYLTFIQPGDLVLVVKGRKVPRGTRLSVSRTGRSQFGFFVQGYATDGSPDCIYCNEDNVQPIRDMAIKRRIMDEALAKNAPITDETFDIYAKNIYWEQGGVNA